MSKKPYTYTFPFQDVEGEKHSDLYHQVAEKDWKNSLVNAWGRKDHASRDRGDGDHSGLA
jgi:hypothetical protein